MAESFEDRSIAPHARLEGSAYSQFLREKPRDLKTILGIFYTPAPMAEVLVNWAIQKRTDVVLEPSFGGCGFLNATARRLHELGQEDPWSQVYGCDIDKRAFKFLPREYQQNREKKQFLRKNFLECCPTDFGRQDFDVVVGNPPYVSRHMMTSKQIGTVEGILNELNQRLSFRASLWAYFVLHSLTFLRDGGRIAWILPRSLSQTIYGKRLLQILKVRFEATLVVSLGQRMFREGGTEEISDLLLGSGYHRNGTQGRLGQLYVESVTEVQNLLNVNEIPLPIIHIASGDTSSGRAAVLTSEQRRALDDLSKLSCAVPLSSLLELKIGIVTGASQFFVLRSKSLSDHGLQRTDCSVVIAKFRQTCGIEVTEEDAFALRFSEERVFLIKCSQRKISRRVQAYLDTFLPEFRKKVATFAKREPWYHVDDKLVPDGFLPCLVRVAPRFVLNHARLNCTNNILRAWFKEGVDSTQRRMLPIALASTFGQLSAEVAGRACGSGGLKIEPSDWLTMKLLLPSAPAQRDVDMAYRDINGLIRASNPEAARNRADEFLCCTIPKIAFSKQRLEECSEALKRLRADRKVRG